GGGPRRPAAGDRRRARASRRAPPSPPRRAPRRGRRDPGSRGRRGVLGVDGIRARCPDGAVPQATRSRVAASYTRRLTTEYGGELSTPTHVAVCDKRAAATR